LPKQNGGKVVFQVLPDAVKVKKGKPTLVVLVKLEFLSASPNLHGQDSHSFAIFVHRSASNL
jgi:hypothetical protein